MTRWIVRFGMVLGGVVLVVVVWGMLLPVQHTAVVSRLVEGAPDDVWEIITDFRGFPDWRPDVDHVEVIEGEKGRVAWRERGAGGSMGLEVLDQARPRRLVTRILPDGQAFGGTWTYDLQAVEGGTQVRIREDGEIYNPAFRFVARYLMGYDATAVRYLDALSRRMETLP